MDPTPNDSKNATTSVSSQQQPSLGPRSNPVVDPEARDPLDATNSNQTNLQGPQYGSGFTAPTLNADLVAEVGPIHVEPIRVRLFRQDNQDQEAWITLDQSHRQEIPVGPPSRCKPNFEQNILFQKPNVAVAVSMLQITVFVALFTVLIGMKKERYHLMIIGYYSEALLELSMLACYMRSSLPQPRMRCWDFLPNLSKWVFLLVATTDLALQHGATVYVCFLPLVGPLYQSTRVFAYSQIKPTPPFLSLVLGVCELMLTLRHFGDVHISYSLIFILPFYYFLMVQFLNMINLMTSLIYFLLAMCGGFKNYSFKLFFIQFFVGCDSIVGCITFLFLSRWTLFIDRSRAIRDAAANDSDPRLQELKETYETNQNKYFRGLQVYSCVMLLYTVARNITLYHFTKKRLSNEEEQMLRSQGGGSFVSQEVNPAANHGAQTGASMTPRVSKPKTSDTILSFIRINPNYYVSNPVEATGPSLVPAASQAVVRREDDQCSLCVAQPQDCIILPCKHGGICKQCSFDWMQKSSRCPFCRKAIDKICVVRMIEQSKYRIVEEISLR